MRISFLLLFWVVGGLSSSAQQLLWSSAVDTSITLSSPRAVDLTNDGIPDIVMGGGRDGVASSKGIMAFNGLNGALLWSRPARNEIFGSALFHDVSGDGVADVIMVGRGTQLLAVNGVNGQLIWDFFPYNSNPADSGLYNFYNPQLIRDVDGDGVNDLLVTNGGNHLAPAWETDRPPGHIFVVNAVTGQSLIRAVVPDSMETYCSPIIADIRGDGSPWILFGTGGETLGGSFWACPLDSLLASHNLDESVPLLTDLSTGYIAPASVHPNKLGGMDIVVQSFGGTISKICGNDFSLVWAYSQPGTQSSAAPALGNFTGNNTPDVFAVLAKGEEPSYTDFYQLMLDGETGQPQFLDSIGTLHFASANAVDLNQDGRDEAVITLSVMENGAYRHRLYQINFISGVVSLLGNQQSGVNLASTPLIIDIDQNDTLDLFYVVKRDSLNPVGWKGFTVNRMALQSPQPYAGVSWGSYMGTQANGHYVLGGVDCGTGSVVSGFQPIPPTCNGASDGGVIVSLAQPAAGHTFSWSNNTQNQNLNGVTAGLYQLVATNDQGCSETIGVDIQDPYVISFGPITPLSCPGEQDAAVMVYSTGCQCMFSTCTYLWDNGGTNKYNDSLHAGYNQVRITHPSGCVVNDSVWIEPAAAVGYTVAVTDISCYGGQTGDLTLSSSGPSLLTQYTWSTGDTTAGISGLLPGVYQVTVKDSRGCGDTLDFEVEENIQDSVRLQVSLLSVSCFGSADGQISLSAAGNYPLTDVLWADGDTSRNRENLAPGTYSVQVQDSRNCRDTLLWEVTSPDALSGNLLVQDAIGVGAANGAVTVTVDGGTSPYQYSWNNQATDSVNEAVLPGMYTVTVTDQRGCTWVDSAVVDFQTGVSSVNGGGVSVYPNPFVRFIQVTGWEGEFSYSLRDARGRTVATGTSSGAIDISEKIQQGVYLLHLKSESAAILYRLLHH